MYKENKKILYFLLLIALLTVLIGCNSTDGNEEGASANNDISTNGTDADSGESGKRELTIGYHVDISNFDPIQGTGGSDHSMLWPIFETLIKFSPTMEPEPGLAESWDYEDDTTIVLNLKENVEFHDGTAFDAEAVKFNLERVNFEDSNVTDIENLDSVEVVDTHTVKLHLSIPDSSIIGALSDRAGMMVSPTAIEEQGENFGQNPIGAGPFKFVERVPNGEIVLEKFDDYWAADDIKLDSMVFKIMTEENTRINALSSSELDIISQVGAANVQNLRDNPDVVVEEVVPVRYMKLYLNKEMEPFNDENVRLAVLYGINRQELIDSINFGEGEAAYQIFPSEYWAHSEEANFEYDPEKAQEIIETEGLEGVSFTIMHYPDAFDTTLAQAIQGQLNPLGFDVKTEAVERLAASTRMFSEKVDQALVAAWTGRPDAQMTVNNIFSESFYNVGYEQDPEIEELVQKAAQTYDDEERAEIYGELSKLAINERGIELPLFFPTMVDAMQPDVKGFEPNLVGKPIYSDIYFEE